jgi:hypothetical protein
MQSIDESREKLEITPSHDSTVYESNKDPINKDLVEAKTLLVTGLRDN